MTQWMAFLDFDGTITSEETMAGSLMSLAPPIPDLEEIGMKMLAREMTLKEGLYHLFAEIESSRVPEFLDYIETVPVRPGFERFLDACDARGIPVVIVSGGIDVMIDNRLAPFRERLAGVWSCHLDTSGKTMRLVSEAETESDPMDKNAIIDTYSFDRSFCVGDGYTDFAMAERADITFARDQLAEFMTEKGMEFFPWVDFTDIAAKIDGGALE
jgi:2-hydroxy-3-keto-5-methylthiopentenyl-1-phosphate phosphatase